uniref:YbbR family protein n=1 Tax=Geobacter sp. (strain M21) TaxID=443144 RepID=C6E5P4_GEOSM
MTQAKSQEWSKGVKALSVLLAVLIWSCVILERPAEIKLNVPVSVERVPSGLWVDSPPPENLQVIVSGPQILLLLLPLRPVRCEIDLSTAGPGELTITPTQGAFGLDPELKVVRVFPESVTVVLARKE